MDSSQLKLPPTRKIVAINIRPQTTDKKHETAAQYARYAYIRRLGHLPVLQINSCALFREQPIKPLVPSPKPTLIPYHLLPYPRLILLFDFTRMEHVLSYAQYAQHELVQSTPILIVVGVVTLYTGFKINAYFKHQKVRYNFVKLDNEISNEYDPLKL
jgi:hypothetical protein